MIHTGKRHACLNNAASIAELVPALQHGASELMVVSVGINGIPRISCGGEH